MICVSIGRGRHRMMTAEHKHLAETGAKLVELRIDFIRRAIKLKQLLEDRKCPAIIACRRSSDGGRWTGSESDRVIILRSAIAEGADYVDLEEDIAADIPRYGKSKRLISYHNFQETPDNLEEIYHRMEKLDPDIIKISTMAHHPGDNSRTLKLCRDAKIPTVAFCMGEIGIPSRVLCGKFGAPFTYASFHADRMMAPGQIAYRDLRDIYRFEDIKPETTIYGVIGDPVSNDMGPLMHNVVFREKNHDAIFLPFRVAREDLKDFIKDCPNFDVGGLNVADPHKEPVLQSIHKPSEDVEAVCLSDTLVFNGNQVSGFNVDRQTAIMKLIEADGGDQELHTFSNRLALILGDDDTAKAMAHGFMERLGKVVLTSSHPKKVAAIADSLGCQSVDWEERYEVSPGIVINCTKIGRHPDVDESPYDRAAFRENMIVMETIYDPEQTLFVKYARGELSPYNQRNRYDGGKNNDAAQVVHWGNSGSKTYAQGNQTGNFGNRGLG